jgi:hypothetical protein
MIKLKSIAIGIVAIGILTILTLGTSHLTMQPFCSGSEQKFVAKLSGKGRSSTHEVPVQPGFAWVKITDDKITI